MSIIILFFLSDEELELWSDEDVDGYENPINSQSSSQSVLRIQPEVCDESTEKKEKNKPVLRLYLFFIFMF